MQMESYCMHFQGKISIVSSSLGANTNDGSTPNCEIDNVVKTEHVWVFDVGKAKG
jgi:hypothetical protein